MRKFPSPSFLLTCFLILAMIFADGRLLAATCGDIGVPDCKSYGQAAYKIPEVDFGATCRQSQTPGLDRVQAAAQAQGFCVQGYYNLTPNILDLPGTYLSVVMYHPQTEKRVVIYLRPTGNNEGPSKTLISGGEVGNDGSPLMQIESFDDRLTNVLKAGLAASRSGDAQGEGFGVDGLSMEEAGAISQAVTTFLDARSKWEMSEANRHAYGEAVQFSINAQNQATVFYRNMTSEAHGAMGLGLADVATWLLGPGDSLGTASTTEVTQFAVDNETQMTLANVAVESAKRGNWSAVVKNWLVLNDFRLVQPSTTAKNHFADLVDSKGVLIGPALGPNTVSIPPKSPISFQLYQAANWVQAGWLNQGTLLGKQDRMDWARSALYHYRAAEYAAKQGRADVAFKNATIALRIGQALAGVDHRVPIGIRDLKSNAAFDLNGTSDARMLIAGGTNGQSAFIAGLNSFGVPRKSRLQWTPEAIQAAGRMKDRLDALEDRIDRFRDVGLVWEDPGTNFAFAFDNLATLLDAVGYRVLSRDFEFIVDLTELAIQVFDASMYVTPTGIFQELEAVLYHKDLITGRQLSDMEVAEALLGLGQRLNVHPSQVHKFLNLPNEAESFHSPSIARPAQSPLTPKIRDLLKNAKYESADVVNRSMKPGTMPPYVPGSRVATFDHPLSADTGFARVHGLNNQEGRWIIQKQAIEGLTPAQIQQKYSLPSPVAEISDIEFTTEQTLRRGLTNANFGGTSGAIQYEIVGDKPLQGVKFVNRRKL